MIPCFLVGLFIEAHHQMLEQIAHLKVVDPIWVQIDIGHRLDDCEKAVAGVQLLDLIGKLEALEDATGGRRESAYVGNEVGCDILGIVEQACKGVGARVVESLFPVRVGGLAEQAIHCRFGHLLRL